MPRKLSDASFIWDMIEHAEQVRRFTAGKRLDEYVLDEKLRFATERCIEIIGEAARRISPAFQQAHPLIPWGKIIAPPLPLDPDQHTR
jgi:uncharacterized protein with HEPN domain